MKRRIVALLAGKRGTFSSTAEPPGRHAVSIPVCRALDQSRHRARPWVRGAELSNERIAVILQQGEPIGGSSLGWRRDPPILKMEPPACHHIPIGLLHVPHRHLRSAGSSNRDHSSRPADSLDLTARHARIVVTPRYVPTGPSSYGCYCRITLGRNAGVTSAPTITLVCPGNIDIAAAPVCERVIVDEGHTVSLCVGDRAVRHGHKRQGNGRAQD
jgi:hypothetical protein